MTIVAASAPPRGQGSGGVIASPGLIPGRNSNADLLVSSVPTPSSPCQMSNYFALSPRPIDSVNETSTPERLVESTCSTELDGEAVSFSLFEAFRTIFLPFLLQFFFGGFEAVRYILTGQLKDFHQESTALHISSQVGWQIESHTAFSCFTCLALLACVAMAVHPDGLTWLALRKLREVLISFIRSSSTCWAWLLNDDTGVISTVFALATFCALFFFCYILHRTLAPKQPRRLSQTESSASSSSCTTNTTANPSSPPCATSKKKKKKKSAAKKRNVPQSPPVELSPQETASRTDHSSEPTRQPPTCSDQRIPEVASSESSESVSRESSPRTVSPRDSPTLLVMSANAITGASGTSRNMTKETEHHLPSSPQPPRVRGLSASTVDTAASSVLDEDTQLLPVPSNSLPKQRNSHQHHRTKRSPNSSSTRGGRSTFNNQSSSLSSSNSQNSNYLVVSSRWDGLKPESQPVTSRTNRLPHNNSQHKQNVAGSTTGPSTLNHRTTGTSAQQHRGHVRGGHSVLHGHRSNTGNQVPLQKETVVPQIVRRSAVDKNRVSPDTRSMQSPLAHVEKHVSKPLRKSPVPPSVTPQSPSDSFFSSTLNPQSPAFAPSTPPKLLRAPPGLCLPPQQVEQSQNGPSSHRIGEFLLPPSYGPYVPVLPSAPAPPPGLLVPAGSTLPSGNSSPLGFHGSLGSVVPDNPFQREEESEAQIEAELQELGGRMIGSILDS